MNKNSRFVPYSGFHFEGGFDILEDPHSQAIVLETIRRYLRLDLRDAKLLGWIDDTLSKNGLHLVIYVNDEIYQDYFIKTTVRGTVCVHLPNKQAIREDPIRKIADTWMKRLRFPAGFPRSVDVEIQQDGHITIEIIPCF